MPGPTDVSPSVPKFGEFVAEALLSQGGGGEVWAARRAGSASRDLVVKVANAPDGPIAAALRREWDHLFSIASAALPVPIEWLPACGGSAPAIVMQRRPGTTFDRALSGASRDTFLAAVDGALRALQAIHVDGVVHGDLHPGNILVDKQANVALLDLGLAEAAGTSAAVGAGLPAFAAPERLRGEGVDPRDDIFSLAACTWHALTGAAPFANYPAMMPDRRERPVVQTDHPMADLLHVLAAWLSPVRELRPSHAELALREWRTLGAVAVPVGNDLLRLAYRPWRWGRWGEPALPQLVPGSVRWLVGAPGSGGSGALCHFASRHAANVAWVRPTPVAGDSPLEATIASVGRASGDAWARSLQTSVAAAAHDDVSGLGEPGGAARSQVCGTVSAVRRALGGTGVLLVDDFELLPESLQGAIAQQHAEPGCAAVVVVSRIAPGGAASVSLPPVTVEEVAASLAAATGGLVDLEVCAAISEAVGCDRSAIFPVVARLLRQGHLACERSRLEPAAGIEAVRTAARTAAAAAAGDDALTLPQSPSVRAVLAHLAVAGRCSPGTSGDPAPAVPAGAFAEFGVVRRLAGGGFAVASERHRLWLMKQLKPFEIASAADARASWLDQRAPMDALALRVIAASIDAQVLPAAKTVAAACGRLTDAAEPGRAVAIADDWLAIGRRSAQRAAVVIAAIRAETALGRYREVAVRVAGLPPKALSSVELRLALADCAFRAGDYPATVTHAQAAIARAKRDHDKVAAGVMIAFANTWQGDLDAAAEAMATALKLDSTGPAAEQFAYLEALAAYYRGEVDAAQAAFASLDTATSAAMRAAAAAGVGLCAHRSGVLDEARNAYDRSRALAEEAGDRGRVVNMTMNIAVLDHEAGDLGRSLAGYGRVIADAERLGNRGALARSRNNRGNLLTLIGDHERAEKDLLSALGQLEEVGNQYLEGNVRCLLAEIARKSGEPSAALTHIDHAIATMNQDDAGAELLEWHMERSECLLAAGEGALARDAAASVLKRATSLGNEELQARAGWGLARCDLAEPVNADLLTDIDERLVACAAAVPESKVVLRVAIEADLAAVKAIRGDTTGAVQLALDSLARLERIAATLTPADAKIFRHGPAHAPRWTLLRVISAIRSDLGAGVSGPAIGNAAMNAVLTLNRRLSAEHDLPRLLEVLMDAAVALTGAERGFLVLDERAAPTAESDMALAGEPDLRVALARNLDQENLRKAAHKLSWSVAVGVFEDGERVVTTDASADPRFAEQASVHTANLRSILCVPLALKGRTVGVLYVDNRFTSGAFTQDHGTVLEALAAQAAIAIHTARLIARYGQSQGNLQASNAEIESLNGQLQERLSDTQEQLSSAREALDAQRLEIERRSDYRQIKGESALLRRLFSLMDRVRKHDFPVIVYGESGTGKELVARAIHFTGVRKAAPFVAINCGAVPENLLESELFGHKRGAFTGAVAERDGLFVSAHRGTLFLDEIGEMPPSMQVKLLRVLQTGEVQAVGGAKLRHVDVRVLAATHRNLDVMVAEGTFREDLLYRLQVVQLQVPALRERTEDLPLLSEHFLAANRAAGLGEVERISAAAMAVMRRYAWPGNVRELETFLKSACLFSNGDVLDLADVSQLQERTDRKNKHAPVQSAAETTDSGVVGVFASGTLGEIERAVIDARLAALDGNKSRVALSLGIDRGTLYNKLRHGG